MINKHPEVPFHELLTFQWRCFHCGCPQHVPIQPGWDSPVYVMEMEKRHRLLEAALDRMGEEVVLLANECLDAGVKPDIMRRADELNEAIRRWRETMGLGGSKDDQAQ